MADQDIDMLDIDLDGPDEEYTAAQPTTAKDIAPQDEPAMDDSVPAAYYEPLVSQEPWLHALNLQGVSDFGPDDPMEYALEHCPDRRPKRIRWVNDNSVNLEYHSPRDADDALFMMTHSDAGVAALIDPQTSRMALRYSKKPQSSLSIRQANSSDRKTRDAATKSEYYHKHPETRAHDEQKRRAREPTPIRLDYGDGDGDEDLMSENPQTGRRRSFSRRDHNPREMRDSYRPERRREPRHGRLRERSASPSASDSGDDDYRRRSRSPDSKRRRPSSRRRHPRDSSVDLERSTWVKDRYDPSPVDRYEPSPTTRHRRSDATDETNKGSLLSRMTKDGRPVVPGSKPSLAARITRDSDQRPSQPRARRRDYDQAVYDDDQFEHRGGDSNAGRPSQRASSNYGRLKDDYSAPTEESYQAPIKRQGGLEGRTTWARDNGGPSPRSSDNGIKIRGTAGSPDLGGGFSIRGAAGGA
ncbi:hypothetical protein M011DRAFT_472266 [Sporormia fimetaria CBS 119925]|uniref:Uncharacterized protein n=1 Tax=Sporormia fimetaria CBS 119925 TaxID=1340428 RepID=A0A6A6UY29_9PLEO|nr:hypothetical protein M011DRAFT_472266 [Sporormia fimetaria CBS 119925]